MVNKVIVIVGPTAVGKSELAVKLARIINGEIISADSMQAYKCMEILSQCPAESERKRAPHHLVNFLKPEEEYSAAMFSRLAEEEIRKITQRGKIPIVVGGSGLYVKALLDGIFPSKGKDEKLRGKLLNLAHKNGRLFLHEKLKGIDREAASKIHPNDLKRIIRALEIYEVEKKTKTSLRSRTKGIKDKYDVRIFGLIMERNRLYERINDRVDLMFERGVVNEVTRLLSRNLSLTSRQALGIRELEGYANNAYSLECAKDMLKRNTRRFAKRQLTWFRADKRIRWIDVTEKSKTETAEAMTA